MAVGNINDAPLELNALAIKDMRLTLPELQSRITYHYRQDTLRQLYRILGSADFIGNPVGLFTNVSSGVADIFYEPFQGVVMHGNRELGIGIAKVRLISNEIRSFFSLPRELQVSSRRQSLVLVTAWPNSPAASEKVWAISSASSQWQVWRWWNRSICRHLWFRVPSKETDVATAK